MYYTGCDAHKRSCTLQHIDEDGALGLSMKIPTTSEGLDSFLDELDAPTVVTFEASRSYWWLYQYLNHHPKVAEVVVVDPFRSRKIAEELAVQKGYGRASNDRIDSEMLAEQTRIGLARSIHVPTAEQLEMRTVCRHRFELVGRTTASTNLIHSTLSMHGVSISLKELLECDQAKNGLYEKIPNYVKLIIEDFKAQIQLFAKQISEFDRLLNKLLPESHPQIKLLMTAPGFGPVCSRIVYTEIFDIAYFKAPKSLINYSGLAPVVQDSDGKKKNIIKLNRHCNYYLKYAFITAAHAARTHPRYRRKYQQDVKKHGKIQAKINLARRLAKAVYWMLNRQQPYKF
ncbi:MAG: IS110 family RNA-guided transposase [Planctomycetota bacterium]|jgi:transposase